MESVSRNKMKSRLLISVLFATFGLGMQYRNSQGFQSEAQAYYSILEEFCKAGVLAYWKATGIIFTDAEKLMCKNVQDQNRVDCSNDTFESSKPRLAAMIRIVLDVSLAATSYVSPGAMRAINEARTVGYNQADQFSNTFYDALLASCEGNTPAARLKLQVLENSSIAGAMAFVANIFSPFRSDESIGDGAKATALISQNRATSEMVNAVQKYFHALDVLANAVSNGTQTARKTACSRIRIFRKEVFRDLEDEIESRCAFWKAFFVANLIIETAG